MANRPVASRRVTSDERLTRAGLVVLAAVQLVLGAFMVLAPNTFHDQVGPYGSPNGHYVRDLASWELALAALAWLAVRRPAWRVPVLALALVHFGLHALNHAVDVGGADPGWLGPANLVLLLVGTGLLAVVLVHARRRETR